MRCAILQPSYMPWRGYFHQIQKSDVFVFLDDVQFDKHGWRNRNRIKTANGSVWLTIPVAKKGNVADHIPISEIDIVWERPWNAKHWQTIRQSYARAPHFAATAALLEPFFAQRPARLADFTIDLTVALAGALGLPTRFVRSSELLAVGSKTDRLIDLLRKVGARHYVSGPSAQSYIEPDKFAAAGITLEYMSYDYAPYPQLHPPYDPQVSIIDLLFMLGPDAPRAIW